MNTTQIYLVTNCYGDPNKVYIGKEKTNIKNIRKYNHRRTYGKQIEFDYIDEINSLKREDWEPLESFWIQYFKFLGFEIINKRKKGGNGPEFQTIETKLKIGKSKLGNKYALGKIKSQEVKSQISNSLIGKKHINHIKGINHGKTGQKDSPQTILKKKKPKPEGFGKKISDIKLSLNIKLSQKHIDNIIKAKNKPTLQYTLDGKFIREHVSAKAAAQFIGSHDVTLRLHLGGKYKTCKGFIFKYK